jgi:hypothetical protein
VQIQSLVGDVESRRPVRSGMYVECRKVRTRQKTLLVSIPSVQNPVSVRASLIIDYTLLAALKIWPSQNLAQAGSLLTCDDPNIFE